jgi:hypothetical protein
LVLTAKPSSKRTGGIERLESLDELWAKVLKWQRWHSRELIKSRELANVNQLTDLATTEEPSKPQPSKS